MGKKRVQLSEQLRRHIDESGVSRYRIWKETGVAQAVLCRFMAGKVGLSLRSLDALGDFLGLDLVSGRKTPRRKGR